MKKIIMGILMILVLTSFKEISTGGKIIPDEAIRLRVLANSNSTHDQLVKEKVKEKLQGNVYYLLKDTKTIDQARTLINNNIDEFDETVANVLDEEDPKLAYTVDFGTHYFPSKVYKGIKYDAGNYESLLVKLGEGKGDNWWCVLFPPLCLLEAEETEKTTDVEYKFFVQELLDKFF